MIILKDKFNDIYNKLYFLLPQFKNICVTNFNSLSSQIDKIVVGVNKLSSYADGSIVELTEDDLKLVSTITNHQFANCSNLIRVVIPDCVTEMGDYAFYNCQNLQSVKIGDSIPYIRKQAFYKCTQLTNVTIGRNVLQIQESAFVDCINLVNIIIPNKVEMILKTAFYGCNNLADIYLYPTTPPALLNTNAIPSSATIHVPIGCGDAYKSATNWSSYASNIVEDIEI